MSAAAELHALGALALEADTAEPPLTAAPPPDNLAEVGNPPPPPMSDAETQAAVSMMFNGAFAIIAPNWQVSGDECEALAASTIPVLNKYFPNAGNYIGVELQLGFSALAVIGSRLGTPRHEVSEPEPEPAPEPAARQPEQRTAPPIPEKLELG